ncbi:glycosyl transferase [Pseudomonas sp. Leaf127]|uniref:glycosyltransferase n=1 Tax=Pseudomonas sp. Leaf127 TaxID=1736267 RepID=UPI00070313FB|nr:glycosyltransferase [Pseudomonas sp. Leaf127]KQQ54809.1 glycosyl transferase [Pseudomonas sp. Leaf127]
MTASAERHVLQFCHGYDGPFLDCARQYASLFAGKGYRVTTVFLTGEYNPDVIADCGSDEVLFMQFSSSAIRGLKLGAIAALRKIAATRRFDFCIAHRFKPVYIALLATKLPVIGVHHAFGDYQRGSRRLFAHLFRQRLSLLGVSDAVRDDMRKSLPKWPAERIETLYNRIDVEQLQGRQCSREEARLELQLPPDAWVVGNVGRLHPDKDQATLLRGFAQALPDLPADSRLVILGKGRLEQSLKDLALALGIGPQVLFLGQVPEARRYFKAFDVFALSSDHEPFGMVLLEAMVAGVPLLATACGGAKEVVEGVGVLFPLGDAEHMAQGLVHVSRLDEQQRQACAEQMLQRLQKRFSDHAVRQVFWQLPQVNRLAVGA